METKALSVRIPLDLYNQITEEAERANLSLNAQVIRMLEGKADGLLLSVLLPKDSVRRAVAYYASNDEGMTPLLETDEQLRNWTIYTLLKVSGFAEGETPITVAVNGEKVAINGNLEIIDAIQSHFV